MFSVIVPTRDRTMELYRALLSLKTQTFNTFECIVVDDASRPARAAKTVVGWMDDPRFRYIELKEHSERATATNIGLDAAEKNWLCLLDSDDEFASHYLEVLFDAIARNPEVRCFNFGTVVHHRRRGERGASYTGTSIRHTFKPKWLDDRHEEFRSGRIGSGSFVFHRDVWDVIEHLPETRSPYKFHELATDVHHLHPFPGPSIGNPWGQDHLLFYRITRKFQSVPLDPAIYIQHVRV